MNFVSLSVTDIFRTFQGTDAGTARASISSSAGKTNVA